MNIYASHQEHNEIFQFASIMILGLFFLSIYLVNKEFTALLYFSLLCIINALRIIVRGHRLIFDLLLPLSWDIAVRLEFLVGYLVFPVFGLFFYHLGYVHKNKALKWFYLGIGAIFGMITLFASNNVYAALLKPYVYLMIAFMFYFSFVLIRGIRKKRWDAMAIMATSLFLFGGILYDYYIRGFTPMIPIAIYCMVIVLSLIVISLIGENSDRALASEIAFLQAQIKPHFLINVLNSLAHLAGTSPDRVEYLVGQLSVYFRNNFDFYNLEAFIPLEKELKTIDAYIAIERERFGDRVAFESIVQVSTQIKIPPLLLQPLVENAIRHGIAKRIEGGKVTLKIYESEKGILFSVHDDGVGMDEDKLQRVLAGEDSGGVAIKNIKARLRRTYGTKLQIRSRKDEGTEASFLIRERGRRS